MTGGCMCRDKRYSAEVENDEAYLCHCRMCQQSAGNVSLALMNLKRADVTWEKEPDRYTSSPIAVRGFCAKCGTTLTYEGDGSESMDLTVGSFDEPGWFRCTSHFGAESVHRHWLDTTGLPETRTEDIPHIKKRWLDATGKMP